MTSTFCFILKALIVKPKNRPMRNTLLFLSLLLFSTITLAQTNLEVNPNDLYAAGGTRSIGNNCFRLTTAQYWEAGSVWYNPKISLLQPFEMEMDILFGCKDEMGADGLVFIFSSQKVPAGYKGEGMGFAGLIPSLGVEIDTYQNRHLGDPDEDHIAIMAQGNIQHYDPEYNLAGPVTLGNLEDCNTHVFRINWEPAEQMLTVMLDGKLVTKKQIDLVGDIFMGQSEIYWGVAAATGKKTNLHEICFNQLSFNEPQLGYSTKRDLIDGEVIDLKPIVFPTRRANLSPSATEELDKLVLFLNEHPKHSIQLFVHSNESTDSNSDKTVSQQRATAMLNYLTKAGIKKDRLSMQPVGSQYAKEQVNGIDILRKGNWVSAYVFIPRV
jgi:hypothetical protein